MDWMSLIQDNGGSRPELYEGIIAEDAQDESTMVEVIITAFSREIRWGPAPWMSRGEGLLPTEGDRCAVGLATTRYEGQPEVWIVAWWPS